MRVRAEGVARRREAVVDVALELFTSHPFDTVTLQSVADGAGVSLKTVTRIFDSKEALIAACIDRAKAREEAERAVSPGDIPGVVAVLSARYEAWLGRTLHIVALSERIPAARAWIDVGRRSHLAWLARAFAPWLPPRGATRTTRLMQLFGATEMYLWWSWREALGHSRAAATRALHETLSALVARWEERGPTS